jgi:O-antigen ligase
LSIATFINAILHKHNFVNIIQDIIPFTYFVLFIPAYHLFTDKKLQEYIIRLLGVYTIGSALFSIYTFVLFVSGIAKLQGPYYKWYRDIITGKITYVTDYFYRIVTPEHLILPFIMLIILSLLMRKENHNSWWKFMFILSGTTLTLNFSRSYFLAFLVGLVVLKYKHTFKKWFLVSTWSLVILAVIFFSTNIIFSAGKSIGLEIVSNRATSLVEPESETSSYTRTMLITPIFEQIKESPLLGSGVGNSINYYNKIENKNINTNQYDWGYFEMLAELGIIGTLLYLSIIFIIILEIIKKIHLLSNYQDIYIGMFSSIIAILVINLTTPALIHVFGVLFLLLVMTFAAQPLTVFDNIVLTIYKIFNKVKK